MLFTVTLFYLVAIFNVFCLFRLRVWDKICNISVSCSFIFSNNVLSATNIPTRGVFVERRCDLELKIKTPSEAKRGGARVQWSVIYFVYCKKKKNNIVKRGWLFKCMHWLRSTASGGKKRCNKPTSREMNSLIFSGFLNRGAPVHLVKNEKYSLQRKIHVKYFKKLRYFCSELRRDAIWNFSCVEKIPRRINCREKPSGLTNTAALTTVQKVRFLPLHDRFQLVVVRAGENLEASIFFPHWFFSTLIFPVFVQPVRNMPVKNLNSCIDVKPDVSGGCGRLQTTVRFCFLLIYGTALLKSKRLNDVVDVLYV